MFERSVRAGSGVARNKIRGLAPFGRAVIPARRLSHPVTSQARALWSNCQRTPQGWHGSTVGG